MRINYVINDIGPIQSFSGGSLCIFEYINRLTEKGHDVTVVPLQYYGHPKEFTFKGKIIATKKKFSIMEKSKWVTTAIIRRINPHLLQRYEERKSPAEVKASYIRYRFESLSNGIKLIPDCDVNIATSYQTALAVYLSGKGIPFYFMQHFEQYFANDSPAPDFSLKDASLTYILPLNKIANSTWLKLEVEKHYPQEKVVAVVTNAINTDIFYPRNVKKIPSKITVVSYGGRKFAWKGFPDAVKAMKIVREKYPDIEWLVYGDALVPPDNDIARYTAVGFVAGDELAKVYSAGDIMLCPSWYESFPLFPLEAMACGLAVITTPFGTEDYARDGKNCLIVSPKYPEEMARAVIRLIEDKTFSESLGKEGIKTAQRFTWERAVEKLEKILSRYVV